MYSLYNNIHLLSPQNNSTHSHWCLNRWPQKWVHPWVKMSKLGPKCQYFVWPPLFSSTTLSLLAMEFTRASQVATCVLFQSSMMTSRGWWMLETLCYSTLRLRMPHRCSIGFRSGDTLGQSITFTLGFLARQWSLSCWNTALRPSLWREGIMLCFSMSEYMLAFMLPSMNSSFSVPAALMQPQTITLPPPCLIVGKTYMLDTIWTK